MQRFPAVSAVPGRWVFQEREEKQGLFHPSVFPAGPLPAPGPHWGQVPLEKQKRFGDCWAWKFRNQNKLCYRRFRAKLKTHRRWRQKIERRCEMVKTGREVILEKINIKMTERKTRRAKITER